MIRTWDAELIKVILSDPELFSRIADDGISSPKDLSINLDENIFLVNDQKTGVFILHPFSSMCAWFHVNIQQHDRVNARRYASQAINWAFDSGIDKLISAIPDYYPDVIGFAQKMGWKLECVITKSTKKHGNVYNQVIYGLERESWDLLEN